VNRRATWKTVASAMLAAVLLACAAARAPELRAPSRPAALAGVAGLALGYGVVPKKTRVQFPEFKVRTAEAWRRRLQSQTPIPLVARLPRIVGVAVAVSFTTEYALALREHGPIDSLDHTTLGQLARACSRRVEPIVLSARSFAERRRDAAVEIWVNSGPKYRSSR